MNTRPTLFPAVLLVVAAALLPVRAQVPNAMYMQGAFLQADGSTPAPGAHAVTLNVYSGTVSALTRTTNVTADSNGVANFQVIDNKLPSIFQGTTNTGFQITGGSRQQFVTAPYAFEAANLPHASGNFTIGGSLSVTGNATLKALTADHGATLKVPLTVAGSATFTNLSGLTFSSTLDIYGGMQVAGVADLNYEVKFTNTTATSVFLGTTNDVIMSNAVIRAPFTVFTNTFATNVTVSSTGTAPSDGFLMVWLVSRKTDHQGNAGVKVEIGELAFTLRFYADVALANQDLRIYRGSSYPMARGTTWSVSLINAGESDRLTFHCHWVPLSGGG